jgi:hypothetical protein
VKQRLYHVPFAGAFVDLLDWQISWLPLEPLRRSVKLVFAIL